MEETLHIWEKLATLPRKADGPSWWDKWSWAVTPVLKVCGITSLSPSSLAPQPGFPSFSWLPHLWPRSFPWQGKKNLNSNLALASSVLSPGFSL